MQALEIKNDLLTTRLQSKEQEISDLARQLLDLQLRASRPMDEAVLEPDAATRMAGDSAIRVDDHAPEDDRTSAAAAGAHSPEATHSEAVLTRRTSFDSKRQHTQLDRPSSALSNRQSRLHHPPSILQAASPCSFKDDRAALQAERNILNVKLQTQIQHSRYADCSA